MKETVIFSDVEAKGHSHTTNVNAIAEVDEFGSPFSAEVLWFKERVGEDVSRKLLAALEQRKIPHSYSEDVDALTLSFGDGLRSSGQSRAVLAMKFHGDALIGLVLADRA